LKATQMTDRIDGQVGNIRFSIDRSVADKLREEYNIDAIKEIQEALTKEKQHEDKSTKG